MASATKIKPLFDYLLVEPMQKDKEEDILAIVEG